MPDRNDAVVIDRGDVGRPGCLRVSNTTYCAPTLNRQPEEAGILARSFDLPEGGSYTWSGGVRAASGPGTDALFDAPGQLKASASSRLVDSVADRPGAALDRDLSTAWVAGRDDFEPRFTVTLPKRRFVTGLQFLRAPTLAASGAAQVTVAFDGRSDVVKANVDDEGYIRFTGRRVKQVSVTFSATRPMVNIDSSTGQRSFLPVGFSELRVLGADDLRKVWNPDARTGTPCGFGPTVTINGEERKTRVSGTLGAVAAGQPLQWRLCGNTNLSLAHGANELVAQPSGEFIPDRLTLERVDGTGTEQQVRPVSLQREGPTRLSVPVGSVREATVVVVPQNFSDGWHARVAGTELRSIRVNGWMQGWVVPAGRTGTVVAEFSPDGIYRGALAAGAVMLILLLALSRVKTGGPAVVPGAAPGGVVATMILLVGGFVVAGLLGVVIAVGVTSLRAARLPWGVRGLLPLALLLGAAVIVVLDPWPAGQANVSSWLVQVLSVSAVLWGAGQGLLPRRWSDYRAPSSTKEEVFSRRRPRRISGRSMP
jgi:arabinofuranan 3-O-arabinosyltransferase